MAFSFTASVPEKYKHIDFKPPQAVADAATKGLEYRAKASPSNKGGLTPSEAAEQGIGSGVQRAVNLKNRDNISPEVIRQMVAFFSRHEKIRGFRRSIEKPRGTTRVMWHGLFGVGIQGKRGLRKSKSKWTQPMKKK